MKKKILSLIMAVTMLIAVLPATSAYAGQADDIVSKAAGEVGYLETTYSDGSWWSKYGSWYGIPGGAWCAMFVSWCANQAGISTSIVPKFASCGVGISWFKERNLWKDRGAYTPKKGDIIFFGTGGQHVGIVENVSGSTVYTIEGNVHNGYGYNYGVRRLNYQLSNTYIIGYGTPNYTGSTSTSNSTTTSSNISEGTYNFACVAGGRYMNVYAGWDWNGVNVCVWDADGSNEQKMRVTSRGNGKYIITPQSSSSGRVIDVNRGNSYYNAIQAGNNIDLWQANDAPAQEWVFTDRGNGKYTIGLASNSELVIACDNPWSNNGNVSLRKYTGAENQLWYLKKI